MDFSISSIARAFDAEEAEQAVGSRDRLVVRAHGARLYKPAMPTWPGNPSARGVQTLPSQRAIFRAATPLIALKCPAAITE